MPLWSINTNKRLSFIYGHRYSSYMKEGSWIKTGGMDMCLAQEKDASGRRWWLQLSCWKWSGHGSRGCHYVPSQPETETVWAGLPRLCHLLLWIAMQCVLGRWGPRKSCEHVANLLFNLYSRSRVGSRRKKAVGPEHCWEGMLETESGMFTKEERELVKFLKWDKTMHSFPPGPLSLPQGDKGRALV